MMLMTLVNTAFSHSKAILFQDQLESFLQIPARFRQGFTLRVDARNFLHPSDIPSPFFFDHGSEFSCHHKDFTTPAETPTAPPDRAGFLESTRKLVSSPGNQEDAGDATNKKSLSPQLLHQHEHGNGRHPQEVHDAGDKQERH
jgi:hypothetical protein